MPSLTMQSLAMGGNALSGVGTIAGGFAKNSEAQSERAQLIQNANNAQGAAQRQAYLDREKTKFIQGRQTAYAAASGAGASDPTVVNLEAETGREGEYAALTDLYNGKTSADAMRYQGAMTSYAGDQALTGSFVDAASTIGGGQSSILKKHGGKLPEWMGGTTLPGFGG